MAIFVLDAQFVAKRTRPLTIAGPPGLGAWYERIFAAAFPGVVHQELAVQLAPPAGVLLTLALGDAAAAWQTVRRSALLPMGLSTPPPHVALRRSPE